VTDNGLSAFREREYMYDEVKTLGMDRFDPKKLNDVELN
jgi:hypothetical protein